MASEVWLELRRNLEKQKGKVSVGAKPIKLQGRKSVIGGTFGSGDPYGSAESVAQQSAATHGPRDESMSVSKRNNAK